MESEIVGKIRKLLVEGIKTEAEVVYLLVEIRKVIEMNERDPQFPKFRLLRFYCNWVVHSNISRWNDKQEVLELIEAILEEINEPGFDGVSLRLANLIGHYHLIDELGDFLTRFSLPNSVIEVNSQWCRFALCLGRVLMDQPLKVVRFVNVAEIRVTDVRNNSLIGEIKSQDGKTHPIDVEIS